MTTPSMHPRHGVDRLIERAFPLKQASLDSVHEKNVRHGHISTLHIWPARRPLAACRAALIATLLPDPGTPEGRKELCEKIGGKVVKTIERKRMPDGSIVEREKEETQGGILHWGRETENQADIEWFRQEIRKAYGGRAPKVLDPFAGGGAIPLEAMRLGCEATAVDINPVAWFILKCTLEYPQKLAGKTHPLPDFILGNEAFMNAFYKAHPHLVGRTKKTKKQIEEEEGFLPQLVKEDSGRAPKADLAWHVRAWGQWVLDHARRDLARFYPTYADFEPCGATVPVANNDKRDACPTIADSIFLNPYEPLDIRQRRLPHWTQDSAAYFVTFRLADSIPHDKLTQWHNEREQWLAEHKEEELTPEDRREYYRLFDHRIETWLDAGEGSCILRQADIRKIVADALRHFDGIRYDLGAWCIMPNHVHVLVRVREGHSLSSVLHSWKSFTAHEINKQLNRTGEVWQHESYDHIVRNPQSLWRIEAYIMNNPIAGSVQHGEYETSRISDMWSVEMVGQPSRLLEGTVAQPSWLPIATSETLAPHPITTSGTLAPHLQTLVPLADDGTPDINELNKEFSKEYLDDKKNPRWVAKPTVAYLWARTVTCKNCRATIPLLKTRWLCKKAKKRVLLTMEPNADKTGVVFGIDSNVSVKGGNAAQRREHDKRTGAGTMSRSGATCPCCGTIMTMEDIRLEGKAGRLASTMTAVVVEERNGKKYRLPTAHEIEVATQAEASLDEVFAQVPFGMPEEPTPKGGGGASRAFSVDGYGFDQWKKLFTPRQLLALGTFVKWTRAAGSITSSGATVPVADNDKRDACPTLSSYPAEWREAIMAGLAIGVDRIADRQSNVCRWDNTRMNLQGTFTRFALPITWDFCEGNPFSDTTGNYVSNLEWAAEFSEHAMGAGLDAPAPIARQQSAVEEHVTGFDCVVTDPPYYDAIPYSDLMDFFYVWLRRTLTGFSPEFDRAFAQPLSPKWDTEKNDGELIDDSSRHCGDRAKSKQAYEDGMSRVFQSCYAALNSTGRLVIVFAHKHPDAWETLVSAIIRAGFVVDGSWPIQTEMPNRTRGLSSAALASSVWLVCRKRPATARPGWDSQVLEEMRENIQGRLREYWDAGIRGPDFVWAATGPAMEAYSKHPVVKKANEPGPMTVNEFLTHVRRIVIDFVVGRVLSGAVWDTETRGLGDAGTRGDGDWETRGHGDTETRSTPLDARDHESSSHNVTELQNRSVTASPCHSHRVPASSSGEAPIGDLDAVTAYYLLHRHDFGMDEAPAGACILYAVSCGVSDRELAQTWDLISFGKGKAEDTSDDDEADADDDAEITDSSGNKVKLKTWAQRKGKSMGYEAAGGKPVPLIDRVHRLMHLWKAGDLSKVDGYIDDNGLRRQELFKRLLQSIIELSPHGSKERSLMESISNHLGTRGAVNDNQMKLL